MGNLRLLVADDHAFVRNGVRAFLEEQPGWEVVAEACNGREAVEKAKLVQPDVTILDLSMPELNGLDATREILKCVSTKVLILTMYDSDHLIRESVEAGARGYVLKSDAGWYVCRHSASASPPTVSPGELSRGHQWGCNSQAPW